MKHHHTATGFLLLITLFLTGCSTTQKLPVDKVVLDWTDFYPVNFQPFDNCNTFKTNIKDIEYIKTYCFEDTMQPSLEDRSYLTIHVIKYDTYSETWKALNDRLANQAESQKVIAEMLSSNARSRCKGDVDRVGKKGFTCTLTDNKDMDLLMVADYLTKPLAGGAGKYLEAYVSRGIKKSQTISEHSSEYKTSIKLLNHDGLKQFL